MTMTTDGAALKNMQSFLKHSCGLSVLFFCLHLCAVGHAQATNSTSSQLCSSSFELDRSLPAHVSNETKACLDEIALTIMHTDGSRAVIVGHYSLTENPNTAAQRAANIKHYLVEEKGIAPDRVEARYGGFIRGKWASAYLLPNRADFTQEMGTKAVPKNIKPTRCDPSDHGESGCTPDCVRPCIPAMPKSTSTVPKS